MADHQNSLLHDYMFTPAKMQDCALVGDTPELTLRNIRCALMVLEDAALGRRGTGDELDEGMAILLNMVYTVTATLEHHMTKAREELNKTIRILQTS